MAHRHTKRCSHKRSSKRATKRSKSYRRRHTRKRGGACGPCSGALMRGGRGYTTGAAATLAQYNGTPGLASGGYRSRGGELNPGAEEFVPAAARANANLNAALASKEKELKRMLNNSQ